MVRGVAGVVTDGGFRDAAVIGELDIPVYHTRPSSPTNLTLHEALDLNVPIGCGDVAVFPGDIVVGDDDSVIVIPREIAGEVADEAVEMTVYEDFVIEQVKGGVPVIGLYPCTRDEYAERFKTWRAERGR
jgi:regulator of RNase E activity RraA